MNPYTPLFSHPVDVAVSWLIVGVWLLASTFVLLNYFRLAARPAERLCTAAAWGALSLSTAIMLLFVIGLVFLVWLKVTSSFWTFYELAYLLSVICLFKALPIFALGLLCWAVIGKWRDHYSGRSLNAVLASLLVLALDVALYFWINHAA